jgi:hypothetical protein
MPKVSLDSRGNPTRGLGPPPLNWTRDDVHAWNRWVAAVRERAEKLDELTIQAHMRGTGIAKRKLSKLAPEMIFLISDLNMLAEMLREDGLRPNASSLDR